MSQSITKARDGFTSTFGVLAATLGSAVGLGNIWKFPYLTGRDRERFEAMLRGFDRPIWV
ncbi:hypothetical protein [Aeromonas sp. PrichA-15]|uniref:hypothetical protein n=1 Tax=Aeromonas sp. PrichA-15 TaxID=2823360 RepID=UPI0032BFE714